MWSCRFQRFFLYTSMDTSVWILAAVTIERFLAVCVPHNHKLLKTPSRAWKVVLAIVIFQMGFNSHVFATYGLQLKVINATLNMTFPCGFQSDASREYLTKYHGWLSFTVYCVIPFVVMLVLNIFIIVKLKNMRRSFTMNRKYSTPTRSQINTISMTRMLLTVTFYFLTVTTPVFIFTIIQEWLFTSSRITAEKYGRMEVVDAVLTIMLYLNHSINFLLYCVTGKRFKRELKRILMCSGDTMGADTTVGGNTTDTPLVDKRFTTLRF